MINLQKILADHAAWLNDSTTGKRCDLRGADLHGSNLRGADLHGSNLSECDLSGCDLGGGSNLSGCDLRGADLHGSNLRGSNLSECDLRWCDLRACNLSGSDLSGSNLSGSNLSGSNLSECDLSECFLNGCDLSGSNLRCTGNMKEIKTLQIERWGIGYTSDTLQIGCQRHAISKWRKWDTPAGRKWIAKMDRHAAEWAERLLPAVLQIIDASPAVPTGKE